MTVKVAKETTPEVIESFVGYIVRTMACALLSIFEPPIVQRIHELARKPDTFEAKLIYYTDPWDHATELEITVPTESTIWDLKIIVCNLGVFNDLAAMDVRLYVNQPWHKRYEEVGDDENVLEFHDEYGELRLEVDEVKLSENSSESEYT